jgi:LCP family protein required for cell wall assembly
MPQAPRYLAARAVTGVLLGTVALCAPNIATGVADLTVEQLVTRNDVGTSDLDSRGSPGAEVWLVLGSDARSAMPSNVAGADPASITGQRADVISLWILAPSGRIATVVSLPRDLRVDVAGHGEQQLGGSYAYGPRATLRAVRDLTELPIHHVAEVDSTGVVRAVDLLGGVELEVPHPARDIASGLRLNAGVQRLTGAEALAWTRSRNYEEFINGAWVPSENGDLSRIERQHLLLAELFSTAHKDWPRSAAVAALGTLRGHVRVDETVRAEDVLLRGQSLLAADPPQFLTFPVQREKPAEELLSPFPPGRIGAVSYLVPAPDARRFLRARVHGAVGV